MNTACEYTTPPPRIIFLNRFFHPDHSATSQMLSGLAFALARRGHQIAIITSRQRYDAPEALLPKRETVEGVQIHRVSTSRFGRAGLIGRAVDYLTFYAAAAAQLWRLARRGDIVVAKTDPPMLSVVTGPIAGWRGCQHVNWLQDVFPEVAEAIALTGRQSNILYRPLRWLRNRSLRAAAVNVTIGERMTERLEHFGINRAQVRAIPNWADGQLIRPIEARGNALRTAWDLTDTFVVGYSGNLGRAHEMETLLGAIAALEHDNADAGLNVTWLFIGGGALLERLKRDVETKRLRSVRFEPYQPRERLAESLSAADVHLVSLRPELEGLIVPSKIYGIAAAGRPAIFIGDRDGEVARLVDRYRFGITVAVNDAHALASAVQDFAGTPDRTRSLGDNARRAFDAHFDLPHAISGWDGVIAALSRAQLESERVAAG